MTEKRSETPYLHIRPPGRIVGVGGEGDPVAKIHGNRAGLLRLRSQIDAALGMDDGLASLSVYRETDERRFELFVQRADKREQMGGPREPEKPDRSMFT